jgi:hypothetical protein
MTKFGVEADATNLKRYEKAINGTKKVLGGLLKLTAAVGVGLAAVGKKHLDNAKKTAAETEAIKQQADALGITTDRYQKYLHAVKRFGLDQNDLSDILNTIADKAEDAKGGAKSMIDDFKLAGVTVQDLKGKKPWEVWELYSDRISKMTDVSKRNSSVVRILGDDVGRKVLPLMIQGSKGIKQYGDEAERLGVILDKGAIEKSRQYSIELFRLDAMVTGFRRRLTMRMIPTLTRWTRKIVDLGIKHRKMIETKVVSFFEKVEKKAKGAYNWLKKYGDGSAINGLKKIATWVASVVGALGGLFVLNKLIAVFTFFGGILKAIAAVGVVPFLKIGAAIAFVVGWITVVTLLIEDFIVWMRGGDSITGRVLKNWKKAGGNLGRLATFFNAVKRAALAFFRVLKRIGGAIWDQLKANARVFFEYASKVWGWIWKRVKPFLSNVLDGATLMFNALADFLEDLDKNWDKYLTKIDDRIRPWLTKIQGYWETFFGYIKAGFEYISKFLGDAQQGADRILAKLSNLPGLGGFYASMRPFVGGQAGAVSSINNQTSNNSSINNSSNDTYNINVGGGGDGMRQGRDVRRGINRQASLKGA